MEDVNISIYRASVVREGSTPASPGFVVSEGQNPVDPSGSGQNHLPVTIATAATGLSITESQVLGGAGTVGQYIRGDGSLADFPESSGGGSSVSYYLNGSVNQGTIGGVAYKELNKVPILGAGTDFTINADGYIASFITDAGDPNLLEIPGGNWNFETYFSASSGGGSPTFYVELYKVNSGGTATLIASNSTFPELIAFGTNIISYFSTLAVPTTALALTDRLAIRYYVTHSGRTITLHTEDNHLCQIITTFTTGLTALNGLTAQIQNFAVGTSGTDFAIASATATHTFNLPTASATNRGALSSADWTTFNGKQNALTNPVTGTGASGQVAYFTGTTAITSESNLFWDATNDRLGINTSNPLASLQVGNGTQTAINEAGNKIHIATNSTRSALVTLANSSGGATVEGIFESSAESADLRVIIGATSNHPVILRSNNTEAMRIFISRNVHIGSTPSSDNGARLQVSGTATFSSSLTTGGQTSVLYNGYDSNVEGLRLGFDTSYYHAISATFSSSAANNKMNFVVNSGNGTRAIGMTLQGNGNVGIGTVSPESLSNNTTLQIDGTNHSFVRTGNSNYGGYFATIPTAEVLCIANVRNPVTGTYNNTGKAASGINLFSLSSNGYIEFYTTATNNSAPSTRMIITASGNVGIGTTNPLLENGGGQVIYNDTVPRLAFRNSTSGTTALDGTDLALVSSDFFIFNREAGAIIFGTSGLPQARITSGGNVLIGTTTDSGQKMQVYSSGTTRIRIDAGGNNTGVLLAESGTSQWSLASAGTTLLFYNELTGATRFSLTSAGIVDMSGPLIVRGTLPADQTDAAVIDHFSNTMRIFSYGAAGVTGDFQFRTAAGGAGSNLVSTINGTTGAYTAVSDVNKKKDFEESTIGLNAILGLKPTLYRMKSETNTQKHLGFIAQEVRQYIPNAYVENGEFIGLNEMPIIAALTKAIQELKQEIDTLKN